MKDISRRKFLQISALAAGATMLPMPVRWLGMSSAQAFAQSPGLLKKDAFLLRGLALPPMVLGAIPNTAFYANDQVNGIPVLGGTPDAGFANTTKYEVTSAEFQDTLHPKLGKTTLWGYHETPSPANLNPPKRHLGGVVIAARGTASRLRMTNSLPPGNIIPNDSTLLTPSDGFAQNRIAIHLHGGYVPWISDGGPFDWWTPNNAGGTGPSFLNGPGSVLDNITPKMTAGQADLYYPNDQSTRLMWYHDHAHGITRTNAYAGLATGYLCLDPKQEPDFGPALPGDPPKLANAPAITSLIPLVFQDKIFVNATPLTGTLATDPTWATVAPKGQTEGSLWYAHIYDPKLYRLRKGRGILPPPNPSSVPEFFGDTMLCNGTVTPVVEVEPKRFRFMLLNACNARFFNINMLQVQPNCEVTTGNLLAVTGVPVGQYNYVTNTPVAALPTAFGQLNSRCPQIIQIGTEGGYLQSPVLFPATTPLASNGNIIPFNPLTFSGNLVVGNAERVDFIIDFSKCFVGDEFIFYSDSPGPFPAGAPTNDYYAGNINTPAAVAGSTVDTRNILRFRVKALTGTADPQVGLPTLPPMDPPAIATAPAVPGGPLTLPANAVPRNLTLNEDFDLYGRLTQKLGTTAPAAIGKGFGLEMMAPATEIIPEKTTEVWRIFNTTADTHPIHFHLQTCQVVSRQPFKLLNGIFTPVGAPRGPEPNELGWKETVKMNPGEVTSVIFRWDMVPVPFNVPPSTRTMGIGNTVIPQANEFVWHCHILEHEEHDMMRPLVITGVNPQRPNISPTFASFPSATGGNPTFTVTLASTATSYSVAASLGAPANTLPVGNTFTVPVAPLTAKGTYTYTVTDNTGLSSSVTITVT